MGTVISKSVAVSTVMAGVISWLPHYASGQLIPLTIVFPALTMLQTSRVGATGVALTYYGVASFPVAQVSSGYFGQASPAVGVLLWIIATMILAAPWIILWHPDSQQVLWRLPAALLVVALPPIGIIGWASPLAAGGTLFPGLGWYGVLLIVLACTATGARRWMPSPRLPSPVCWRISRTKGLGYSTRRGWGSTPDSAAALPWTIRRWISRSPRLSRQRPWIRKRGWSSSRNCSFGGGEGHRPVLAAHIR